MNRLLKKYGSLDLLMLSPESLFSPEHGRQLFLQAYKYEDCLLINPGSATGAFGSMTSDATPSFVLMDINNSKAG